MDLIKLKCENCGATLEVDSSEDKIICKYCKAEILIDDEATKVRRVEEAKLKARKENHEQELKERQELHEQEMSEQREKDEEEAKKKFKKGAFSKVLLVFFALAVIFLFIGTGFFAKLLIIIQAALFMTSWLMGMRIVKSPFKGLYIILAIVAFIMILPIIQTSGGTKKETKKEYKDINWEYIILKDQLPKLENKKGNITSNTDNSLYVTISCESEDEYRQYIELCKNFGYTIDMKNGTSTFDAKKEDYKLRLSYFESSKEYIIDLNKIKPVEETTKTETVSQPKEETKEEVKEEVKTEPEVTTTSSGLRSDFKNAMDSYESFIDEYISFMNKYSSSGGTDVTLLKDYATYTQKYAKMCKDFEKWNESDLNDEELKYYIEVQNRVNQKLINAGVNQ